MNKKLITARREVERLRLEADGADKPAIAIWEAGNRVSDLEAAERESAVRTARKAGLIMDVVLLVVALLTMAFSLQNIHDFAAAHGVQDPIAWFLAPAVDLALLAALMGDAVLSRYGLSAGAWATRLRWFAGATTVALNGWESIAKGDPAGIVLHVVPPLLLFVLAEAASPYRVKFAETVRLAAEQAAADRADTAPVSTPAPAEADTVDTAPAPVPATEADTVYDQAADPVVSTMTPQVATPAAPAPVEASTEADTAGGRLDATAARQAIEAAWEAGLTIREAAVQATRSASYVGGVYAQLAKARGPQPSKGQTTIEEAA
ncbi:DUF2637 domain-containing protein [Streptomyces sp. NPDC087568]|uniref:DUF2637 domain-containing protein n=1 Tax=Streptomyces sp. NPDC087568 TaxID=3365799 RepID=UPI00380BF87E